MCREGKIFSFISNTLPAGLNNILLTNSLNKVYQQAIASWNVALEPAISFNYAQADNNPTFDGYPLTEQTYTPDMQALVDKYKINHTIADNTYYVFLVDNPQRATQLGVMPFNQEFAFVYVDKLQDAKRFAKALAHELGHGAFALEHPWRQHSGIDTFSLPNLMSYHPSSTTLGKWQWQLVQNPACPTTGCQGEAGMEEDRSKLPLITVWIDIQIINEQNAEILKAKIFKSFKNYTIFWLGYNIDVVYEQPNSKIFKNKFNIFVFLTDEKIYDIYPGIYEQTGFGFKAQTPGNYSLPIWVLMRKGVNNNKQDLDVLTFRLMHELGHRITKVATDNVDREECRCSRYHTVSNHDTELSLMADGDKMEKYLTQNPNFTIDDYAQMGYFKIKDIDRLKIITTFLMKLISKAI